MACPPSGSALCSLPFEVRQNILTHLFSCTALSLLLSNHSCLPSATRSNFKHKTHRQQALPFPDLAILGSCKRLRHEALFALMSRTTVLLAIDEYAIGPVNLPSQSPPWIWENVHSLTLRLGSDWEKLRWSFPFQICPKLQSVRLDVEKTGVTDLVATEDEARQWLHGDRSLLLRELVSRTKDMFLRRIGGKRGRWRGVGWGVRREARKAREVRGWGLIWSERVNLMVEDSTSGGSSCDELDLVFDWDSLEVMEGQESLVEAVKTCLKRIDERGDPNAIGAHAARYLSV